MGVKHACSECPKEYAEPHDLKNHKKSAHEGVYFQCDQCKKTYSQHKILLKHEREHHGLEDNCKQCYKSFKGKDAMNHHIDRQHGGLRFMCDQCDFKANRNFELKVHLNTVHCD